MAAEGNDIAAAREALKARLGQVERMGGKGGLVRRQAARTQAGPDMKKFKDAVRKQCPGKMIPVTRVLISGVNATRLLQFDNPEFLGNMPGHFWAFIGKRKEIKVTPSGSHGAAPKSAKPRAPAQAPIDLPTIDANCDEQAGI